ncbi:MAG: hypothetical protein OXC19_16370 [Bryobacterales bacterium]|nr:hypothetical protein [Bryobacterales bacterium]
MWIDGPPDSSQTGELPAIPPVLPPEMFGATFGALSSDHFPVASVDNPLPEAPLDGSLGRDYEIGGD